MNRYDIVAITPMDSETLEPEPYSGVLGWAIYDFDLRRLSSMHLWETPEEAMAHCMEQNESLLVRAHWPAEDDPELSAILAGVGQEGDIWSQDPVLNKLTAAETLARKRAGLDADN